MKKLLALVLALMILSLSACTSSQTETAAQDAASEDTESATAETETTTEETDETASGTDSEQSEEMTEAKRIVPVENTIDVSQMENAIQSVGFSSENISQENGTYTVTLTVYSYDTYDMADMAQLAVGDTIVVDGDDMVVTSKEENNGVYEVNGGYATGGADFATGGDNVYYVVGPDDAKNYFEVGTLTVPVSNSFVLTDDSDPDQPGQTYTAADLKKLAEETPSFYAGNTVAVIENGELISLTRSYTP